MAFVIGMKKVIIPIIPILIIICGIICFTYFEQTKIPKVKTITPTPSKISSSLLTTGEVEPQHQTIIYARSSGVIEQVLVDENEKVEVGQKLIVFDSEYASKKLEDAQANLRQAKEKFTLAENSFVNTTKLYEEQKISEEEVEYSKSLYEKALSEKNIAEEKVRLANEHLNNLVYLAPQSGIVIEKNISPGKYVVANQILMKIIDTDKLQVCVTSSAMNAKRIKLGQPAFIKSKNLDKELTGYVKYIEPEEERQDPSIAKIIIELNPTKTKELPKIGEQVEVKIMLDLKKNVLLVNSEAVFKQGHQSFVYLYRNGVVVKRVVRVGITEQHQTEIIFGISPKDKIILPGKFELKEGMRVRI